MREYPIIFFGLMVRAILEGRKTQTRRVVKNQDPFDDFQILPPFGLKCPYGQPGDRLWVRETFATNIPGCPNGISYQADHNNLMGDGPTFPIKWRSSVYMRRSDSRITLEIIGIRVERLQNISDKEIRFEGFIRRPDFIDFWNSINAFRGFGWSMNPWVWVIEFNRITAE